MFINFRAHFWFVFYIHLWFFFHFGSSLMNIHISQVIQMKEEPFFTQKNGQINRLNVSLFIIIYLAMTVVKATFHLKSWKWMLFFSFTIETLPFNIINALLSLFSFDFSFYFLIMTIFIVDKRCVLYI